MSYILDALRKSELERQKATGQGISLPYPITIKHESDSRLTPVLLAVVAAVCVGLAIWWIGFAGKDSKPASTPLVSAPPIAPLPKPVVADTAAESLPKPLKRMDGIHSERTAKIPHTQPAANPAVPAPVAVVPSKPDSDPLKGLPPLEVAGFMHNDQGGNMAIINNRLMQEGDEVSPGLRVEKIKDDSVIFSYKGYVFSR